MSGSFVPPELRTRIRALATPVAVGLGRLGLSPNALTVIGFLIAVVAAAAAVVHAWLAAGLLVIFGGVFDMFDGVLARATGTASRLGAFLDSTFDRWGEGAVFFGIAWGALDLGLRLPVILAAAAMASAFMVSYTRTRSEGLGFLTGAGMANIGLAPREVRLVILTIGLIAAGVLPGQPLDAVTGGPAADAPSVLALDVALGLIAVLATITTIQRIIATVGQANRQPGE